MNKKNIFVIILTFFVLQNQSQEIKELKEFNDLLKILYKSNVAILFMLNDKNNEGLTSLNNMNDYILKEKLNFYYSVVFSNCENLTEFCENEKLDKNKNYVFISRLHEFDKFDLNKENLEKMKKTLKVNVSEINNLQKYEELKNSEDPNLSIIFNFKEMNTVLEGKIDQTIKKCISNCFETNKIKNFIKLNPENIPQDNFFNSEENINRVFILQNQKLTKLKSEDFIPQEVISSINIETTPDVLNLNFSNYMKILTHPISNKIYLIERGHKCLDVEKHFKEASIHNKNEDLFSQRVLFTRIDLNQIEHDFYKPSYKFIESLLGQNELENDNCVILISKTENGNVKKYLMDISDGYTKYEIINFVDEFNDMKLREVYYISENVPEEKFFKGTQVYKVVSKNFDEVVKNPERDFLLAVFHHHNKNSEILINFMELLRQKVSDIDFGYILYSKNEISTLKTHMFPSFIYYKLKKKYYPNVFKEEFNYPGLVQHLSDNSGQKVELDNDLKTSFLNIIKKINPEDKEIIETFLNEVFLQENQEL